MNIKNLFPMIKLRNIWNYFNTSRWLGKTCQGFPNIIKGLGRMEKMGHNYETKGTLMQI